MAPIRSERKILSTNASPASDMGTFEGMPLKLEKKSVYARCSSVSLVAEEESVHQVQDIGKEYYRSLALNFKTTSSVMILEKCANLGSPHRETWPGVCAGLDEDPRQRKVKQRVAIDPEKENSKEAVENDDNSYSFSLRWQQKEEITFFSPDTENRCEKKTTKGFEVDGFKTDVKAKEEFSFNILTIPNSVQESSIISDDLFSLEPPSASSEVIEVQDEISTKEETTNDETAEVKVEEAGQLSKTESKHKSIPRRHAAKRKKQNVWSITVPDLPAMQHKQAKKTSKTVKERKPRSVRRCAPKQSCLSFEEIIESINHIKPAPSKRRKPNSNLGEPKDSGVDSEGISSGSSDGCSSNSESGSGNSSGGSSSGGGFGGKGNADGDEGEGDKKKYPPLDFPNDKQQIDTPGRNEKKRSSDEEKDDESVEKMKEDFPTTKQSGSQEGTHMTRTGKVADEEKKDSMSQEYTYLLTSQLENQRRYFQDKITQIEKDAAEQVYPLVWLWNIWCTLVSLAVLSNFRYSFFFGEIFQMNSTEERTKKTLEEHKKLELKLAEVELEKKNLDKKFTQVASKADKLVKDLEEEQELNKCLIENQKLLEEEVKKVEDKLRDAEATKHQEVSDLKEQLADLMRHLEMQQAISNTPVETHQELQDGQLFLGEGSSPAHQSKGKSRRKK